MINIIYDDRENDASVYFDTVSGKRPATVMSQRLARGDFIIQSGEKLCAIIERKTWNDLASSIKDGRLAQQIANMNELGIAKIFIIEGRMRAQHEHIDSQALQGKLNSLIMQGFAVIYTNSTEHTVQTVFDLADHAQAGAFVEANKLLKAADPVMTPKQMCLCAIPRISINTANVIIDNKITIIQLLNLETEKLSKLTYPSGNIIGEKNAKIIYEAMGSKNTWIKILEAIKGVSHETAKKIVNDNPDPLTWTVDTINKSRKGEKLAQRILSILYE